MEHVLDSKYKEGEKEEKRLDMYEKNAEAVQKAREERAPFFLSCNRNGIPTLNRLVL